MKKVLIVRLDAIGDYILWRNCLRFIRNSEAYRDASLTILGNPAWRDLAEAFDADCADEWIWVDNRQKLFRTSWENLLPEFIWRRRVARRQTALRTELLARNFDEVISPTAFPDAQLDDLVCGLAPITIGVDTGDGIRAARFTRLLNAGSHPFVFLMNREIAADLVGEPCTVPLRLEPPVQVSKRNEVLLFRGASHWTRCWPYYGELAQLVSRRLGVQVCFAGHKSDPSSSLSEFAKKMAQAVAVVSNDTMALHMAAALGIPAVGICNGVSGKDSFWPYPKALGKKVEMVVPRKNFISVLPGLVGHQTAQYRALSSIVPEDVLNHLIEIGLSVHV